MKESYTTLAQEENHEAPEEEGLTCKIEALSSKHVGSGVVVLKVDKRHVNKSGLGKPVMILLQDEEERKKITQIRLKSNPTVSRCSILTLQWESRRYPESQKEQKKGTERNFTTISAF